MICFLGKTDLRPLANAMTEFIPVVGVVDFYWPGTVNECLREGQLLDISFMKQSVSWAEFEKLTRFLFDKCVPA